MAVARGVIVGAIAPLYILSAWARSPGGSGARGMGLAASALNQLAVLGLLAGAVASPRARLAQRFTIIRWSRRRRRMTRIVIVLTLGLLVAGAPVAWAFTCPVVIKQAEDLIKKAESGKVTVDTKPLIEEARKQVAEARAHHDNARTKRDHGDAVRKAKVAAAFAEEAIVLQGQ